MFARGVDFKLEKTHNTYIACRALSIRARYINGHAQDAAPEIGTGSQNPTVGALLDYSLNHIAVTIPPVDP